MDSRSFLFSYVTCVLRTPVFLQDEGQLRDCGRAKDEFAALEFEQGSLLLSVYFVENHTIRHPVE